MRPRSSSPIVPIYLVRQPQPGAGDHGARHLSSRAEDLFDERHLTRVSRKMGNDEKGVGGIESYADDVELGFHIGYCSAKV